MTVAPHTGMSGHSFASRAIPRLLAYAAARGADIRELITRFDLPPSVLSEAEVEIELADFRAFSDAVAELIDEPFLGLKVAQSFHNRLGGTIEALFFNCETVYEGVERVVRFQSLLNSPTHFELFKNERELGYEQRVLGDSQGAGRVHAEWCAARTVQGIRELTRMPVVATRVWFIHPAPLAIAPLVDFFGTDDIRFGEHTDGIAFDIEVGSMRSALVNPATRALIERAAEAEATSATPGDLIRRIRTRLRSQLENGAPSLEDVARGFGMGERTLQRRIRDLGTTFQALLDDERRALALSWVRDGSVDLHALPSALGYVQKEAFWRAFKRWTGTTPARYRKLVLAAS